jgi:hypothetical protein
VPFVTVRRAYARTHAARDIDRAVYFCFREQLSPVYPGPLGIRYVFSVTDLGLEYSMLLIHGFLA